MMICLWATERKEREKITAELNSYIMSAPSTTCKVQLNISLCLKMIASHFSPWKGMAGGPVRGDDVVRQKAAKSWFSHVKCPDLCQRQPTTKPTSSLSLIEQKYNNRKKG